MHILITGAAGWLGRKLTDELGSDHDLLLTDAVDPAEATVFDSTAASGRRLAPLTPNWPYLRADLQDTERLTEFANGVDVIVHLAAIPTGEWLKVKQTLETNVLGSNSVFQAARNGGVRRVVNASSVNAFGTFYWRVSGREPVRSALPLQESERPVPEDPYSLSKFMTEELGLAYWRAFGTEVCNLRFAGVWSHDTWSRITREGLPPTTQFPPDLAQWIHEDDVTQGIRLAATTAHVTPDPIVLAAGDTTMPESTLDVLQRFRPDLLSTIREPLNDRSGLVSIERARSRLGYQPRHTLYEAAKWPGGARTARTVYASGAT